MVNPYSTLIGAAGVLMSLATPAIAAGPGDLLISPVRVVFEGRDRVAEVTLVNKGDRDAVYRISFQNRRMTENGGFETVENAEDGLQFAEDMVRFAPRRVELAPNAPQTIRLMLRKPAELPDGEYRSHLHFAAVPKSSETNAIGVQGGDSDGISIALTPIYGVTIPVIVRDGDVNVSASFDNVDIQTDSDGRTKLNATLQRDGNKSLYGDIGLYRVGKKDAIAELRGIAVYTPNTHRNLSIPLSADALKALQQGDVEIRFDERTASATTTIAAAAVALSR